MDPQSYLGHAKKTDDFLSRSRCLDIAGELGARRKTAKLTVSTMYELDPDDTKLVEVYTTLASKYCHKRTLVTVLDDMRSEVSNPDTRKWYDDKIEAVKSQMNLVDRISYFFKT